MGKQTRQSIRCPVTVQRVLERRTEYTDDYTISQALLAFRSLLCPIRHPKQNRIVEGYECIYQVVSFKFSRVKYI